MTSKTSRFILTASIIAGTLSFASWDPSHGRTAQDASEEDTRQIKLSDFTKKRPAATTPTTGSKPKSTQPGGDSASWNAPTYKRVKPKPTVRKKPVKTVTTNPVGSTNRPHTSQPKGSNNTSKVGPSEVREVGVTMWRLRPARRTDNGPGFSVLKEGQLVVMTPERIESTATVSLGDQVRLSIESPRTGYLYVINREQYADGTTGAPALIFPTLRIRNGDNVVEAGRLVDIPDAGDPQPFFTLTTQQQPGQPRNVGELLTILITPRPIEGLTPGRSPIALNPEQVAKWEADWDVVELLEMNGGAGQTWTAQEKLASQTTRALTQVDPTPQSIYRVTSKANHPVMLTVQMIYGK